MSPRKKAMPKKRFGFHPPAWNLMLFWLTSISGGFLTGMGVFLLVQVKLIVRMREQVFEFSGITRWIGKMTFLWRGFDQKVALVLSEIPQDYVDYADQTAWGLTLSGLGLFAIFVPAVLAWASFGRR